MLGMFYLTRLSWNETRLNPQEGEDAEYKTYLIGASHVGVPQFLYGRSPFASWGITAASPDAMDLFVEDVDETKGTYFDVIS